MNYRIIVIILAIAGVIALLFFNSSKTNKPAENFVKVKIGNAEVKAEIADTLLKQIKGLMFRESLAANDGMLFIFNDSGFHSIWMMNMKIPIDIIWLNENKKVVSIKENAPPCSFNCTSYRPMEQASYVLEVNAGFAKSHNIKEGTVAEFLY